MTPGSTPNLDAALAQLANLVTATNALSTTLAKVLPVVQSTAATATAGAAVLPANPLGFLNITLPNGSAAKVPYYNV